MHQIRRDINVLIPKLGKLLFLWMLLFLNINLTFKRIFFRGRESDENFWDVIPTPLPKIVDCENLNLFSNPTSSIRDLNIFNRETIIPNTVLPGIVESSTKGEILPTVPKERNTELRVYTRRENRQKSREPTVPSAQVQSDASGNEPINTSGTLDYSLPNVVSIPNELSIQKDLDLDIPIAIRKGTRSCTNHPISKYLSYGKLSKKHRAFTSKISNLFVPRNIQEALDDLNWKSAVMEEMDALRKSGTWEIIDLPRD